MVNISPLIGQLSVFGFDKSTLETLPDGLILFIFVPVSLTKKVKPARETPVDTKNKPRKPRTNIKYFDDSIDVFFVIFSIIVLFHRQL